MKYGLFPYNTGESATFWNKPLLELNYIPTELTQEMFAQCVQTLNYRPQVHKPLEQLKAMSIYELAEYVNDVLGYSFDTIAVVPVDKFDRIKIVAESLLEINGDDSMTCALCEGFGMLLKKYSVGQFDFPSMYD